MGTSDVSSFRQRKSPSSERFLCLFSKPEPESVNSDSADDELHEDEVFWTVDFSESNHHLNPPSTTANQNHRYMGFRRPDNFGIRAAVPEDEKKRILGDSPFLYRKTSIPSSSSVSSSRMIPAIPKPQSPHKREYSLSVPSGKFHQSAPVNVPMLSKTAAAASKRRNPTVFEVNDEDAEDEMLPPHEIVARGSNRSPMTTFSVLEGVGRTLKGRDLRQVRNVVWRQTGFLD